ncbi:hypothetical protein [Methyloglobulus sp.]|uniref:hypothetical protein n=1 Tax=Methyloglobulus sp. TaxID=2518622 RepID=UPI003988BBD5
MQEELYELVRSIKNAEQQHSSEAIKRKIAKISKDQVEFQQQLANLNDNLYLQLQTPLPLDSFEILTRVLAKSVLCLSVAEGKAIDLHDKSAFQSFITALESKLSVNRLELPGFSLDVSALEPSLILKTAQELETKTSDCE